MAKFVMSAFADEASQKLDEQIEQLKIAGVSLVELRGVDGGNCSDLTVESAKAIKAKLDANGIRLSSLGSPYGKIGINDPFEEHLEKLKKSFEVCKILECDKIRMFSFYLPHDDEPEKYREAVFERLEKMVDAAEAEGIFLCHENEKGIYGDNAERCQELYEHFGGRLGIIFDPANYIQCGVDPMKAYELQKDTITYFHMKDALMKDGSVVSVGNGDGSVPEILADVMKSREDEVILTVEPHLHVFSGLQNLQSEELLHKESYPDSVTAFQAACSAVKSVIGKLN